MSAGQDGNSTQSAETTVAMAEEYRISILERDPVAAPAFRFEAGDVLADRFHIIRFLGRGGMGEVYEAEDRFFSGAQLHGVHVALKTLSYKGASAPGAVERFKKEVLLGRQIMHPNICPIYDAGPYQDSESDGFFLTMKLLSGVTLKRRLAGGPLPLDEALPVTRQIVSALQALHREGVVHRDLKPGNIMLEGSGSAVKAVVTDFGLARKMDLGPEGVRESQFFGTPGYLAPEILNGLMTTPACDLYSLGVIVHEIFCARKPTTRPGVDSAEVHPDFLVSGAPPSYIDLVQECLSQDAVRRYRSFAAFLQRLEPEAEVDRFEQEESASQMRIVRPTWTRRKMLGASALSSLALAAAAYYEHDEISDWLLNPLPAKRFVAILEWPSVSDKKLGPAVNGIIDAIERELSRVEAFDRNLLVIAPPNPSGAAGARFVEVRDSWGANLILATSGVSENNQYRISLKLLDPSTSRTLRQRSIASPEVDFAELASKAVAAAAALLQVSNHVSTAEQRNSPTASPEALAAFQQAESLMKQPNRDGIAASIEKYKEALELDSRFALAQAQLATAYCVLHGVTHESAALDLAELNAKAALAIHPRLVPPHQALSYVYESRGKEDDALRESAAALALDPADPTTLIWRGDLLMQLNRAEEAELAYRRVTRERPNYWLAHQQLGWALDSMCRYHEALQSFRLANLLTPKNVLALKNMGATELKLGRYREARQHIEAGYRMRPTSDAACALAQLFRVTGQFPEAVRMAENAVALDPHQDLAWLELGDCESAAPGRSTAGRQAARKAYRRALTEAEAALQTNPAFGPTLMSVALYRLKAGEADATLAAVAQAEAAGALEPDSQLVKVRILELIGKRDDAIATLRRLFQKGVTAFEVDFIADLQSLRRDPQYLAISPQKPA